MDINSSSYEHYRKSALVTINTVEQTVSDIGPVLLDLGNVCYRSGLSISTDSSHHYIHRKGLYRVDAALTFVPLKDGILTVYLTVDGQKLSASVRTQTVHIGDTYTINVAVPAFNADQALVGDAAVEMYCKGATGEITCVMVGTVKLA